MICPDCVGERTHLALVDRADGTGGLERIACASCGATGAVDESHPARVAWGYGLRARRRAARVFLHEAARASGVRIGRYSAFERGVAVPTPEERARCEELYP